MGKLDPHCNAVGHLNLVGFLLKLETRNSQLSTTASRIDRMSMGNDDDGVDVMHR